MKSYLENRKICTVIGRKLSSFFENKHGIPQRSVLGHILFLLYVNDLSQASKFSTTLFADDANLNISHHDSKTLQIKVNEEMKKIACWMSINKLTLNYDKSSFMIIGRTKLDSSQFKLTINDSNIKRTDWLIKNKP